MNAIINGINIKEKFGITVTDISVSPAVPVTVVTSVPGRNGVIDQSKAVSGFIDFENRVLTIKGYICESYAEYLARYSAVINAIDGDIVEIINDADEDFAWKGRPATTYEHTDAVHSEISIECEVFPYKRKVQETVVSREIEGVVSIECANLSEPVIPEITLSAPMTIKFGGSTFALDAGTHKVDMVFVAGNNILKAEGSGSLTVRYREGCL